MPNVFAYVTKCPRCKCAVHGYIFLREFWNPFNDEFDVVSHWTKCPATEEPILFHESDVKKSQELGKTGNAYIEGI